MSTALFNWKKRDIDADVIVFGHTHYPEVNKPKKGRIKLLVNTGSWIKQTNDQIQFDTFAYINDREPRLFRWLAPCEIRELTNELEC